MKKYGILGAVAAVVVAALAGWCIFRGSGDSMASSLPKDVSMVARIDLKGMVLDYGLSLEEAKELLFSKGDDRKETGLDLFTPAFAFAANGYLGLIVAVDDAEKLETYLREDEGIGNIEEQRGLKWGVLGGNVLMGFSDDRLMIMGPAVGHELDELRNIVATCLKQSASNSGKKSRLYKLINKRSEPVSLAMNTTVVPEEVLNSVPAVLKKVNLNAIDLVAGLRVKKENITLGATLETEDERVKEALEDIDDVLQPIDGALLRSTPKDAPIHLAMGLDGDDLLEFLRKDQTIRTGLLMINALFDFDMIMKSIDGDVSLSMSLPTNVGRVGEVAQDYFLFQAELEDDKFMKNITSWNDDVARDLGVSFYAKDARNGICKANDIEIFFATPEGKQLKISNGEWLLGQKENGQWDMAKGNRIFLAINPKELNTMGFFGVYVPLAAFFDAITIAMPSISEMKVEFQMSEGTDLLRELNIID